MQKNALCIIVDEEEEDVMITQEYTDPKGPRHMQIAFVSMDQANYSERGPLCIEINTLMEMRHFNAARPVPCSSFCSVTSVQHLSQQLIAFLLKTS